MLRFYNGTLQRKTPYCRLATGRFYFSFEPPKEIFPFGHVIIHRPHRIHSPDCKLFSPNLICTGHCFLHAWQFGIQCRLHPIQQKDHLPIIFPISARPDLYFFSYHLPPLSQAASEKKEYFRKILPALQSL